MERPSSRGGAGLPAGPQAAARPSSRGGQYVAQGAVRPGTGMRPGTGARAALGSRQGTAMRAPPNMAGVGMSAANICRTAARPYLLLEKSTTRDGSEMGWMRSRVRRAAVVDKRVGLGPSARMASYQA